MSRLALTLAILAAPLLAAADGQETWSVVGLLRSDDAPGLEPLELVRGALSLEVAGGGGRVLSEEETRLRLGIPRGGLAKVREAIDAAELYYFQLELTAARSNLERALEELGHAAGVPEAWELDRMARMLLAMVHLAAEDAGGRALARAELERLARLERALPAGRSRYPAELVALYEEVRAEVEKAPRGTLRASCAAACPDGHVWIDGQPRAIPGEAVELPEGAYQVVVTDRFEQPAVRSLPRRVEVAAGRESSVVVELGWEGALVADGPWIGTAAGTRLPELSRRLGVDRLLVVEAAEEGRVRGWLLDGAGGVLAEADEALAPGDRAAGYGALVRALVRPSASEPLALAPAAGGLELGLDPRPPARAARPPEWLPWARWSTAAAAAVAAGAGGWLHVSAASEEEELHGRLRGWGGIFPSGEAARAGRETLSDVASRRAWGTGLLVGAGVAGASAIALFLLEPDGPPGSLALRF